MRRSRLHHKDFRHFQEYGEWPDHNHLQKVLHGKRKTVFRVFLIFFGLILLLSSLGIGSIFWIVSQWMGGNSEMHDHMVMPVPAMIVPILVFIIMAGLWIFRRFGSPLAVIMAAADAVADGDLTVRVPEKGPREFSKLALSFNRMVRELQRSDQQRRNLTADVAHELRTPLHIIQGNLEGMLDGVYQADEEHIQVILDETRQLARLVNDLHTLSLAESGQLPLNVESVRMDELINDIETSFSSQAEMQGIKIQKEIRGSPQVLTIQGDSGRFYQVMGNLVNNALRHTPAGGIITLTLEPHFDGVRITVADTGEGIAAEDLPFIFDRFWRGDRSRTHNNSPSSGLGLAICKQFVQAHGGKIEAQSEFGKGTIFIIDLPAIP